MEVAENLRQQIGQLSFLCGGDLLPQGRAPQHRARIRDLANVRGRRIAADLGQGLLRRMRALLRALASPQRSRRACAAHLEDSESLRIA